MDWTQIRTQLVLGSLLALASGATGWLFGTSQTAKIASDLGSVQGRVITLEGRDKNTRQFLQCVGTALDRLSHGVRDNLTCELKVD